MIANDTQIDGFRRIAEALATSMLVNDFNSEGLITLKSLTDGIRSIYKNVNLKKHDKIIIIKSLAAPITPLLNIETELLQLNSTLTSITEKEFLIEIKDNGELLVVRKNIPDIELLRHQAIVYSYENENEFFYGKAERRQLPSISGIDSYFAISTFKSLDEALEFYKVKYALYSSCKTLNESWFDTDTRIFFKPKPEFLLRDSLYDFLHARLRENVEIVRESNMDETHPVDIKITWNYTSHIAIIEIKWLGKSFDKGKNSFTEYSQSRAISGANQLADYVEMINSTSADKITKGYLVVFDARREKATKTLANSSKIQISSANALKFENDDITFSPEYHKVRPHEFATPYRFFIRPKYI